MIALIILLAITVIIVSSSILYFKKGFFKKIYHDILQWHLPDDSSYFDGYSVYSKCRHCGMDIMQDSRGNWF